MDHYLIIGDLFDLDPCSESPKARYIENGALRIQNGKIVERGSSESLRKKHPSLDVKDFSGRLILPGFIDSHVHYTQLYIIGSYGRHLMDWLQSYTYPAEQAFSNADYSRQAAHIFLNSMLRQGTTSCVAYTSVFEQSCAALFEAAENLGLRIAAGKVCMDRNAPVQLCDTPEDAYTASARLIEQWHGRSRLQYAITPRFAITSSPEQLRLLGRLCSEFPDCHVQTHLSEDATEIQNVKDLFPSFADYLSVYETYGLIGPRTLLGHGNYLSDSALDRIACAGATIVHCPTSNLFIGSGLFPLERTVSHGVKVNIATDVGGGTSLSLLKTLGESYKIQQLNHYSLHPFEAFYRITLGAARSLGWDKLVGCLEPGLEADFCIIKSEATLLQQERRYYLERNSHFDIESRLFGLMISADERNIEKVFVNGKLPDVFSESRE